MAIAMPNQTILGQNGAASGAHLRAAQPEPESDVDQVLEESQPAAMTPDQEIELLRAELAVLRCTVEELEKLLEDKTQAEQVWTEKQKELEALVEEKSDVIRELHIKLHDERTGAAAAREPAPAATEAPRNLVSAPREEELLALSEELEHERRQLQEDEETVKTQMREMEIQMSRERAELARQRNELQRLHGEIVHELELASRHAALRDRLEPLQRRHQDMLHRKGSEPSRDEPSAATAPSPVAAPAQDATAKNNTGLLHRLFG